MEPHDLEAEALLARYWLEEENGHVGISAWLADQDEVRLFPEIAILVQGLHDRINAAQRPLQRMVQTSSSTDSWSRMEPVGGDHELRRRIGAGGMGEVWEAYQRSLDRLVAIKLIRPERVNVEALERFSREARAGGRLTHPGIVMTLDHRVEGDRAWIALELVPGGKTLKDFIADRGTRSDLPADHYVHVADLVAKIADALEFAHSLGIVHRDIKPGNILLHPTGQPKISDFGLAQIQDETMTDGDVPGTYAYMSPEQIRAERSELDHRTDIFSLGVVLYELLTLRRPFEGETRVQLAAKILIQEPPDPRTIRSSVPRDLCVIVNKAIEKEPSHRYASASALASDLRRFLSGEPILALAPTRADRALKWMKRRPTQAALYGTLAVMSLVAIHSRRVSEKNLELNRRQEAQLHEEALQAAYLDLGMNRDKQAEISFRGLIKNSTHSRPDPEALGGLILALLDQRLAMEAIEEVSNFERKFSRDAVSVRLLVLAHKEAGEYNLASELASSLPEPAAQERAIVEYIEGLGLLRGTTYRLMVNQPRWVYDNLAPADESRLKEAMERIASASLKKERALYAYLWAWAAWAAEDKSSARDAAERIKLWEDKAMSWFFIGVAQEVYAPDKAVASFQKALDMDSSLVEARERLAVLRARDSGPEAVTLFEGIARDFPERASVQLNLASLRLSLRQFASSIGAARKAIQLDDDLPQAYAVLGQGLFSTGDLAAAAVAIEKALQLEPDNPIFLNNLGKCLIDLKRPEKALEYLKHANLLAPNNSIYLFNLGLAESQMDNSMEQGIEHLDAALDAQDSKPQDEFPTAEVWQALGQALESAGRLDESLEAWVQSAREEPREARFAFNAALTLARAGRCQEALEFFERAIELGDERGEVFGELVRCLTAVRRFREALSWSERWRTAHQQDPQALNWLAWLQVDPDGDPEIRNVQAALDTVNKALLLSSEEQPEFLDTLAWALFASDKRKDALDVARRALELAEKTGKMESVESCRNTIQRMSR